MICTNCQSKEVIRVQNEYFCTNCGHTMPDLLAVAALELDKTGLPAGVNIIGADESASVPADNEPAKTPSAQEAEKQSVLPATKAIVEEPASLIGPSTIVNHTHPIPTEKPKKRRVGRPKAPRLDVPAEGAIVHEIRPPKTAEAPKIHAVTAVHKAKNSPAAGTNMSDLRPARPSVAKHDYQEAAEIVAPAKLAQSKPQAIQTGDILAESWQGRFRPHHSLLALVPAVIIALIAGGIAAAILGPKSGQLLDITKSAAIPVLGDLVIILALYYVCRTLATAAITFAAARAADHRKAPVGRWWGVAVNSFGAKFRLDLSMLAAEAVVLGLMVGLVLVGGIAWPVPEYLQIAAIFGAFVVLLYALVGLALAQGLGRVSVVLGSTGPRLAIGVGWGFFRNHFELVSAKLLSLILELALLVPLAAAVVAVGWFTLSSTNWWFILALTIAVALGGALIGAGTAVWWESAYRHLVRAERLSEAVELLTSRGAEKARRWPQFMVVSLIVVLIIAATIWPWLPWPVL